MRLSSIFAMGALGMAALAPAARAAPYVGQVSSIEVVVGTELSDKAAAYGKHDLDRLADYLRMTVRQELERSGRLAAPGEVGSRVILVVNDAKPNRPTLEQFAKTPSLSPQSVSVGGATIGGEVLSPDGVRVPIVFKWYEQDIRNEVATTTWNDAEHAFDALARRLASGEAPLLD